MPKSEEVDFSQEIIAGENGEISLEPISEVEDVEEETEEQQEEESTEEEGNEETEVETESETEQEDNEETEKKELTFESFEATIGGQKISIDSAEEAQKIINNLSKPQVKSQDVWEQAQKELGVTTKDLALVSAIKSGDKDALLFIAKEADIDISQLIYDEAPESFDKDFKPTVETEGQRIMSEISASGEIESFSAAIDGTDTNFIENLGNVENLNAFRQQVASGKAAELMPLAKKMSTMENISLFEAYSKVGHAQKKQADSKKVAEKVTKKTPPAKKAGISGKKAKTAYDPWAGSDEDFMKEHGQRKI